MAADQREKLFLANGGLLQEKLIALTNGIYNPFRTFSVTELEKATNNYDRRSFSGESGDWYRGFFQGRVVFIRKFFCIDSKIRPASRVKQIGERKVGRAVNDIAITAQTSGHKNVLKLLGCCLETSVPILVYESAENGNLFERIHECSESHPEAIPWKIRLKIAVEVAHVVAYLHTAFPRRIIYRSLNPRNIFLDEEYNAKLCNFSQSMSIRHDEVGKPSWFSGYAEYCKPRQWREVTEKVDVYSFGALLLELLIGRRTAYLKEFHVRRDRFHFGWNGLESYLPDCPLQYSVTCDNIEDIVDRGILAEGGGGIDEQQQWHAVKELALSCLEEEGEKRPTMVEVTKQLRQIQRSLTMVAERQRSFSEEGSMLMEKLMASCNSSGHVVRKFSAEELKRAARNYDPCCIFGVSDLGMWYKGSLDEQAISICKVSSFNWREHVEKEFKIALQSSAHKNLLKLLGCCLETSVPTLVYESAENGNLIDQIDVPCGPHPQHMLWNGVLKISRQIADGIAFLHTAFSKPIIHTDIKLSNIFFDEYHDAKISNFSHSVLINGRETQITNSYAGTQSLISPEYANDTELSEKTDVYSFGRLLYHVLIGRAPHGLYGFEGEVIRGDFRFWFENVSGNLLVHYLKYYFQCHCIDEVVDPRSLNMGEGHDQWQEVVKLTFECMDKMAEKRPTMVEVAERLRQIERSLTTVTARELSILEDGRVFMEELIASYHGMFRPLLQFFSAEELKKATNNYDPGYIFNCSNHGIWYKGCVGHQRISVCKIRWTNWKENVKNEMEFSLELGARKNVLKLIGCCLETPVPALVYESAKNGTLFDRIHRGGASLPLNKRLKIAKQIANEVASLHLAYSRPIIHRNIKSASIYLDKHWVPKLSNFSQSVSIGQNEIFVADRIEGSKGYLAPEFLIDGVVSEKLDVYSFGVVLIELLIESKLSGLFDLADEEADEEGGRTSLCDLVNYVRSRSISEVVDAKCQKKATAFREQRKLEEMMELAFSCIKTSMEERPTMAQVAQDISPSKGSGSSTFLRFY